MKRVDYFVRQGFKTLPGYDTFFLGNIVTIGQFNKDKQHAQQTNGEIVQTLFTYLMDQSTESKAVNSFDCGEHPNVLVKTGNDISLITADPNIIQDMLVTKNALIDKTGIFEGIFKNFYLNAFVFAKNDERWKAKRKATAHAFYKDKTVHMLDVLKMYIKRP